ncbi:TPA: replication protein [Streptococcus pyogenes]|nr:replication protein [Streptococcus pyogenes]
MKIKFDIELSGKKYLTLSNRQLSVHLLSIDNKINNIEYRLGWSIDRITLVGAIKQTRNSDGTIKDLSSIMQELLDSGMKGVEKLPKGWLLRDRQNEQIAYIEYLSTDNTRGRIDFNPNKLSEYLQSTLKEFISLIFEDVKFSRIDVACDIFNIPEEVIEQYTIIKDVSTHTYRGRGGQLETHYWGSSSSEKQVRLYNKLKERKKKRFGVVKGIETWWRFEAQLRGKTTKEWFESVSELLSYFTSPCFIPLDVVGMEKITLISLLEHPELFKEISSRTTISKYKTLVKRVVENDELTTAMIEQFEDDITELQKNLDSWLGYIDVTDSYTEED